MNADSQQKGVHHLADDKLRNLEVEFLCDDHQESDPTDHVNDVSDDEVTQHHVSHEENERKGQLNLQLVETGSSPLPDVLGLEREQHQKYNDTVNQQ